MYIFYGDGENNNPSSFSSLYIWNQGSTVLTWDIGLPASRLLVNKEGTGNWKIRVPFQRSSECAPIPLIPWRNSPMFPQGSGVKHRKPSISGCHIMAGMPPPTLCFSKVFQGHQGHSKCQKNTTGIYDFSIPKTQKYRIFLNKLQAKSRRSLFSTIPKNYVDLW